MTAASLTLTGVTAGYGELVILDEVSLDVGAGETVGIIGRNGMGKTTLLATIAGRTRIHGGEVAMSGTPITRDSRVSRSKRGIGLVPQEREVFPTLTVEENLKVAARTEGFTLDRAYALFPRLKERRSNLGARLSGGEQQMLSIARALMCNPTLLLMDEPSEGLAPVIVDELYAALERIAAEEGVTLLLVEQNVHRALSFAGRAIGLRNGTIVYDGPSKALVDDEATLDRIMGVRAE
ncbi:ABC transporter ATP-binding protein [Amorphus orientalis]|uniref:Branched-chain amino acid transport system ATP-binding protein n=1 Tax=Amorphus orientalis TaxID=649198 RepID=A0AAE4ARS4_9HYPH|nr:ABC transporter ATP-binding protein [Amorphus orientalis]MDQ0314398.1 branched-chain amino acid transport system ATP-binding protein [Amorphus orientalis]